jgi:hypothetical protein
MKPDNPVEDFDKGREVSRDNLVESLLGGTTGKMEVRGRMGGVCDRAVAGGDSASRSFYSALVNR